MVASDGIAEAVLDNALMRWVLQGNAKAASAASLDLFVRMQNSLVLTRVEFFPNSTMWLQVKTSFAEQKNIPIGEMKLYDNASFAELGDGQVVDASWRNRVVRAKVGGTQGGTGRKVRSAAELRADCLMSKWRREKEQGGKEVVGG